MKFVRLFDQFLADTVNLNQARIDVAARGREVVADWLKANALFKDYYIEVSPQGSYRQGTIIRPAFGNTEFDVDLLFDMKPVPGWEPKAYLEKLHAEFKKTARYKDIVDKRGKTRCVTLDYESDFHIDIIPSVERDGKRVIFNRSTNEEEVSDGDGYAAWFEGRAAICRKKRLVKVVRLVKYLRGKHKLEAKSILLTTLLAQQVYDRDSCDALYCDVPTALNTIVGRLDNYLQANPQMITVTNPSLPSEHFNRHWNQKRYETFRTTFHNIAARIKTAYDMPDEEESWKRWTDVFGDEFPKGAQKGTTAALASSRSTASVSEHFAHYPSPTEEWIDRTYGFPLSPGSAVLRIDAHVSQPGYRSFRLSERRSALNRGAQLDFVIPYTTAPAGTTYYWKVRNGGEMAMLRGDLRGGIRQDTGSRTIRERTSYRGSHYVECYAVHRGRCIAIARLEVLVE